MFKGVWVATVWAFAASMIAGSLVAQDTPALLVVPSKEQYVACALRIYWWLCALDSQLRIALSTLSGALHGGVGRVVHESLVSRALVQDGAVAFGHLVHRHGDPRTGPLLDAVYGFASPADRDLIEGARRAAQGRPNVDFALGALTYAARMPPEAGTAIFAVARTAGWIAHAAEEYGEPALRFRGRAFRKARTTPRAGMTFWVNKSRLERS